MSSHALHNSMTTRLSKRRNSSALRKLSLTPSTSIDFSSNDFLSLSTSNELRHAFLRELTGKPGFRLGSAGSRLLDGNSPYAEKLEEEIASFHGAKSALLFNSGFDANEGFFACVPQKGDVVIYDAFIHASVHEGLKLSRAASVLPFSHNSLTDLRSHILSLLQSDAQIAVGSHSLFVAIEALYSMDGDLAPIREIVELVEKMLPHGNGHVVVDEAHSNGIYGERGRGLVCSLGLEDRIFARLHTFGKALACNGAAILCDPLTREYLINYAKPLIYTTSMSFPSLAAITSVYSFMKQGATIALTIHLDQLVGYMFEQLTTLLPFVTHPRSQSELLKVPEKVPRSPIFALQTPEPRSLAAHCQAAGFVVRPIVPPTVPVNTQRVRVCLHAGNTFEEIERLVANMKLWLEREQRSESSETREQVLTKAML